MQYGHFTLSHIMHFSRVCVCVCANTPPKAPRKIQACPCFPLIFPHHPSEWGLVRTTGLYSKHLGHQEPPGRAAAAAGSAHGSPGCPRHECRKSQPWPPVPVPCTASAATPGSSGPPATELEEPVCGRAVFLVPVLNADAVLPPLRGGLSGVLIGSSPSTVTCYFPLSPSCPTTQLESDESLSLQ